jgi:HEAT repeat protein
VQPLTHALKDKERSVRLAAAVALGQLGPAAATALPGLGNAMKDNDVEVRNAATHARRLIEGR